MSMVLIFTVKVGNEKVNELYTSKLVISFDTGYRSHYFLLHLLARSIPILL